MTKTFGRIQGDHSNLLGQCQTWGGGGAITKVINSCEGRGDQFNEITFKGGSAKFHRV